MAKYPPEPELIDTIRTAIVAELHRGAPSIERIADRLHVSTRTLQRDIGQRGTSFTKLVQEVRMEAACIMLRETQMPLSAIALTLGYSGVSSFSRAFRRSRQDSARAYRARVSRPGQTAH